MSSVDLTYSESDAYRYRLWSVESTLTSKRQRGDLNFHFLHFINLSKLCEQQRLSYCGLYSSSTLLHFHLHHNFNLINSTWRRNLGLATNPSQVRQLHSHSTCSTADQLSTVTTPTINSAHCWVILGLATNPSQVDQL